MQKVFLISFFAIFLMPFSAFAAAPSFEREGCKYVAITHDDAENMYTAYCSGKEFVHYYGPSRLDPKGGIIRVYEYSPSRHWEWVYRFSTSESIPLSSKSSVVQSNFDIKNDDGSVFFSLHTHVLKSLPKVLLEQAGGILSVVLTGFVTLLAVGLVPRWRSWFLRL